MRQLNEHPVRTLGTILITAFVLFMISGIPAVRNASGWTFADAVGYVAWFGFLLLALAFIVGGIYTLVRRGTRRTA